jgi:hypothetical protein
MNNEEIVFDFGFTAMNETELEAVTTATATADTVQEKLDKLYSSIQPLIRNLKKNPEKEYIYWPNRLDKIEAFEEMIKAIYTN